MSEEALQASLIAALLPYLRGFLSTPDVAVLVIRVTTTQVIGSLSVAPNDFVNIDSSSALRAHFSRTFNTLSRFMDATRAATFTVQAGE